MTDAQVMTLLRHYIKHDVRFVSFNANDHDAILSIHFYDGGHNWHMIGITPAGLLQTYE